MRRLSIVLGVFALAFAMMPAATAHRGHMMHGEISGVGGPVFDPGYVAARCPDGFEWAYQTAGIGALDTREFSGDITELVGEHCSRWHVRPPTDPDKWYLGRVGDGEMTLVTDEGNLVLTYRGKFRFRGDVSINPPEFVSLIRLFYRVDGEASTGVFAGARGVGLINIVDKFEAGIPSFSGELRGPIHFAK